MRRLSIIDVAGGHQPIFNEARDLVCVCNGEIYNYLELAQQLQRAGHVFGTRSDVEVVIHGYETWGESVFDRLNGMFGLALWNARKERLILARDRLGKKPLYYSTTGNSIVFASELRSLLQFPNRHWTIDRDACKAFCELGYLPQHRTPIREIRRLPPGHFAVWNGTELALHRYWEAQPSAPLSSQTEASDALFSLLQDAVRLRLISDVPIGAFLSGGLDSSVVVAMAAELGARIPTFSIRFPGYRSHDEGNYARIVAQHFGSEHHEIPFDAHQFHEAASLVWALDEPLADPAALPTLLLSRAARRTVTVALTGEGADEVFGGYERYAISLHGSALEKRLGIVAQIAKATLRLRVARGSDDSAASRILRAAAKGGVDPLIWSRLLARTPALTQPGWDFSASELEVPSSPATLSTNGSDRLKTLQLDDLNGMLPNALLTKVDRMTMAASLEARCPFLDYRIVNFGLGLPDTWKIRGATTKVLLRSVARRLLPPRIYRRPKHTFRVPIGTWLRGPLRHLALEAESSSMLTELVSPAGLRDIVQNHLTGRADYGKALWALVTLHLWLVQAAQKTTLESLSR
jgi:asparagine synthase (glutamine-hydrolysing)